MGRQSVYKVPTISKRIPNYALRQVEHFTQLLDERGEIRVQISIPGDDGVPALMNVVYSQLGVQVHGEAAHSTHSAIELTPTTAAAAATAPAISPAPAPAPVPVVIEIEDGDIEDGDQPTPETAPAIAHWQPIVIEIEDGDDEAEPEQTADAAQFATPLPVVIEIEDGDQPALELEAAESDEPTEVEPTGDLSNNVVTPVESSEAIEAPEEQLDEEIAPLAAPDLDALKSFATKVFEGWQSLSNEVWGEPVRIEQLYDKHFRGMLVLSFLSQLGAVAELDVRIPQGRLSLTSRNQDGTLFQVGRQTAGSLTFTQIGGRKLSEPISPMQVQQEVAELAPADEGLTGAKGAMVKESAATAVVQARPKRQAVAAAPVPLTPMPAASTPISAESTAGAAPVGVSRLQRLSLSLPSEKVGQAPEPAFQPPQEQRQSGPRFMLRSFLGLG